MSAPRGRASRLTGWLLDSGPVAVVALIAGAGSFTHIRDTATEHGQNGWMAWAVAVCVDLTCVMAARERQRDKKTRRQRSGPVSWPTLVLAGGIVLSLAANLAQADPSVWGWVTAATPAVAFLVAVSMLERRAVLGPSSSPAAVPVPIPVPGSSPHPVTETPDVPALVPGDAPPVPGQDGREDEQDGPSPSLSSGLLDYARRVAAEHHAKHGKPITRDTLRARLGVSNQLATELLRQLRSVPETA
ncbi:DUF2637 domain-containing protein [Sphaerisporangium corydalis]|uniref:DUF2637 domain-containing protein n=1 Tax=Sphaerisporangium corydalis TaxID=1441875 RepID=A0ABV9EWA3_9ACTN|nr:DUF2637 domain-containing protein [Sphaerisporangium corydalis]